MKKLVMLAILMMPIAACSATQQGAAVGGAGGAAVGAAVNDDELEGAVIGGAAGAVAGALIGRASEGSNQCIYEDEYGREYTDDCPQGY